MPVAGERGGAGAGVGAGVNQNFVVPDSGFLPLAVEFGRARLRQFRIPRDCDFLVSRGKPYG